jgi:phospholipid/cholesterol/gamma-HCH transport system substrate-binding protein
MQSRALEILVGFFFSLGVAAIFVLTFRVASVGGLAGGRGYHVLASFENIGGLKPGAQVTLAGVRIGRVQNIQINKDNFEADVTMAIGTDFDNIPKDSNAKILTAGVLGEQYIGLEPGGDPDSLKEGDKIKFTQSAVVLENLIGQFMAQKASEGSKDSGGGKDSGGNGNGGDKPGAPATQGPRK